MTANSWTDSGKPRPYPTGELGHCMLCGVPAGDTWDGLALCGECEDEMRRALVDESKNPRVCVDCGEVFKPRSERSIRCNGCQVVSDFG